MLKRALVTKLESSVKKELVHTLTEIPTAIENANNFLKEQGKKECFYLDFPSELQVELHVSIRVQDLDDYDADESCHFDTVSIKFNVPIKK